MLRNADSHIIYELSAANLAAARAQDGATIVYVTKDCSSGQISGPIYKIPGRDHASEHGISDEVAYTLCSASADLHFYRVVSPQLTDCTDDLPFLLLSYHHAEDC